MSVPATPGPQGRHAAEPPGPTVLIVEDNPDNLTIYSTILRVSGFRVIEATDGERGIALAGSARPDLILMDVAIPVVDGWEATRRLKADPSTAAIPVVALTAHALEEHRLRSFEAGCDAYLAKPVEPKVVLETVRRMLAPLPGP